MGWLRGCGCEVLEYPLHRREGGASWDSTRTLLVECRQLLQQTRGCFVDPGRGGGACCVGARRANLVCLLHTSWELWHHPAIGPVDDS